jgi:hypothetical protein
VVMKNVFGISATNCWTNRCRASASLAASLAHSDVFHWRSQCSRATVEYEKLSQSPVFDSGSCVLHGGFRGGQAELSEDRQELSDERQQGMQLWKELRLRLVSLATLS